MANTTNLSFSKLTTVPSLNLIPGRIYFETSTGLIKIAKSETAIDVFGGVRDAHWDAETKHLTITNANGTVIDLDLSDVASATEVASALSQKADTSYVNTELNKKVDKVVGKQLSTEDYTTTEKTKLSGIAAGAQVNVIETIKVNGEPVSPGSNKDVNITVPTVTVTGVASEDKILKLSGGTLSSELSLSYSTETKKIILSGQDSVEIASIDATQFVKDGMVQNVSFDPETKVLTIAFNTDAGIENIEVDLASLVDAYTAGSGITISKNVISVDTSTIATKQSVTDIDTKLGSGFSSESTVSQQLAAVKTTAEAATTVSEVDNQIDVKLAELTVADKDSGFVRSVTQTNGLIEVTKLPILETDIPNLSISKINNLQSELNNKVPTTRKVNGLSLNQDITLKGSDIALTGYEKGTESSSIVATDTINKAISKLENKIDVAASTGVQSIGGAVGVITLRNGQAATSPAVNLTIAEKELRADVIGVATTAQGNKADTALQSVTASGSNYLTLTANSKSGTTQNLTGSITIQSITTASSEQNGLVEANDVKEYVTSMFQWVDFV